MQPNIPQHYSEDIPFEQQVLFVLSRMKKGSAGEVAAELVELQGVSSEDGVADLTQYTEKQLQKLFAEHQVQLIKEKHQKNRYTISNPNSL